MRSPKGLGGGDDIVWNSKRLLRSLCSPSMTQGILDLALGILEFLKSLALR